MILRGKQPVKTSSPPRCVLYIQMIGNLLAAPSLSLPASPRIKFLRCEREFIHPSISAHIYTHRRKGGKSQSESPFSLSFALEYTAADRHVFSAVENAAARGKATSRIRIYIYVPNVIYTYAHRSSGARASEQTRGSADGGGGASRDTYACTPPAETYLREPLHV